MFKIKKKQVLRFNTPKMFNKYFLESLGLYIAYSVEICERFKENGVFQKFENVRDHLYTCLKNRKLKEFTKKKIIVGTQLLDKIHL